MPKKQQDIVFLDTSDTEKNLILQSLFGKIPPQEYTKLTNKQNIEQFLADKIDTFTFYWGRPPITDASKLDQVLQVLTHQIIILGTNKDNLAETLKIDSDVIDHIITKPFNLYSVKEGFDKGHKFFSSKTELLELKKDLSVLTQEENTFTAENRIHKVPPNVKSNPMFFEICANYYSQIDEVHKAVKLYQQGLQLNKYHRGCLIGYIKSLYFYKVWDKAIYLSKILLSSTIIDPDTLHFLIKISLLEKNIDLYKLLDQYVQKYFSSDNESQKQFALATFVHLKNKFAEISNEDFHKYLSRLKKIKDQLPELLVILGEVLYLNNEEIKLNSVARMAQKERIEKNYTERILFYEAILRTHDPKKISNQIKTLINNGYDSTCFRKVLNLLFAEHPEAEEFQEIKSLLQDTEASLITD